MKVRLLCLYILIFCWGNSVPIESFAFKSETKDQSVSEILKNLSLEEKIGQILMIGMHEKNFNKSLKSHVQKIKPGFIILFKKNIETPSQTLSLIQSTEDFFEKNEIVPPIFTVDQEGGDVVRVPTSPPLPTALAVGDLQDPKLARNLGSSIGNILGKLHIYMNLAPVLDLTEYKPDSFIQTRSFGRSADTVYLMAKNFIEGQHEHKVLSTAKHFPGIGFTANDSHKSISFADMNEEELVKSLEPYKKLVRDAKLDAVMMTHHIYTNIDSLPATYSKKIINVLRSKIGFKGLVVTDDVEMIGAKIYKNPEARAVEAFLAGNDVIMVAWNKKSQVRAYRGLLKAYKDGIITDERLNESVKRILMAKKRTPLFQPTKSSLEDVLITLKDDSLKETIGTILQRKVDQEFKKLKIDPSTITKFAVASSDPNFVNEFAKHTKARRIFISSQTTPSALKPRKNEFLVFHVSGPKSSQLLKSAQRFTSSDNLLIVNSRFRGLLGEQLPAIHIQMKHPDLGRVVAGKFVEIENRSLTSDAKN